MSGDLPMQGYVWLLDPLVILNFEDDRLVGMDASDLSFLLEAYYQLQNRMRRSVSVGANDQACASAVTDRRYKAPRSGWLLVGIGQDGGAGGGVGKDAGGGFQNHFRGERPVDVGQLAVAIGGVPEKQVEGNVLGDGRGGLLLDR